MRIGLFVVLLTNLNLFAQIGSPIPTPIRSVTTLPATCNGGTVTKPTDEVVLITAGVGVVYFCDVNNTWAILSGSGLPTGVAAGYELVSTAVNGAPIYQKKIPVDIRDPSIPAGSLGAKCDGVTDDTAAIQAYFNYYGTAGAGGTQSVEFTPVGSCVVSNQLVFEGNNSIGIRLVGTKGQNGGKPGTQFLWKGPNFGTMLLVLGTNGSSIENIDFNLNPNGGGANHGAQNGVWFEASNTVTQVTYNLASISRTGNVVTAVTTGAHAFTAGRIAKVAGTTGGTTSFNGTFQVLYTNDNTHVSWIQGGANESATPSLGTVTNYRSTSSNNLNILHSEIISPESVTSTIASISLGAGPYTITTTSPHFVFIGDTIVANGGLSDSSYACPYIATAVPTSTTITAVVLPGAQCAPSAAGSTGGTLTSGSSGVRVGHRDAATEEVATLAIDDVFVQGDQLGSSVNCFEADNGGNVKDFYFHKIQVNGCRYGLNGFSSGPLNVYGYIGGLNTPDSAAALAAVDFINNAGQISIQGAESEGQNYRSFVSTASPGAANIHLDTISFQGGAPTDDIEIVAGGALTITSSLFENNRAVGSVPFISLGNPLFGTLTQSLISIGNTYTNTAVGCAGPSCGYIPVKDGSGNIWHNTSGSYYDGKNTNITSVGDQGTVANHTGNTISLNTALPGFVSGGIISSFGFIDSALTPGTSPICPNGTNGAFTTVGCAAGGTVSSVGSGTGLTGGPITGSGTISLVVPVTTANGGTGVTGTLSGLVLGGNPFTALSETDGDVVYGVGGVWGKSSTPNINIGGNANTATTAGNLSGPVALPNGVTVTTQPLGDNSGDAASDAFVLANADPSRINQVTVSGVSNPCSGGPCTGATFGQALLTAITDQTGLHTFDGSGFSGTQTWNTSGYLGVGGTGHITLPCAAINLSVSITMALRTGLNACNPEGTNFNVQNSFPTKPTGGTVSTQNAASGGCAGNCVIGSGTNFVSGMSSIVINGTPYSVVSVQSSTLLTLATQPGSSSGQSYTADQPVITWGPGSTFAAPISNFQVNCETGAADIGINNAGSQENSTTTNVRVQDCPVANFQLSNTDGSINSHVQNVYMANLNSLYLNGPCSPSTRAFYSNTNGSGVYIDKMTAVLGNGVGGDGCQQSSGPPTAAVEVNGPIMANDWHVEGNRLGDGTLLVPSLIAVGLTNAGNSHNDTFIGTKFATAHLGAGFKLFSGVTSFMALNTDGAGSQLTDLIYDVANGNHITLANNTGLPLYMLDNNGNAFMYGGNCFDMNTGLCMGQSTTTLEYVSGGTVQYSLNTTGGLYLNPITYTTMSGITCNTAAEGTMYAINNSNTATFNATITGAGTNHGIAYCNGTNWTFR